VVDYLLKPYPFERFLKAVSKITVEEIQTPIHRNSAGEKPFIFVKGNKQLHKIFTEDILYIESQRDYLKFKIKDQADVITRQTIGYYEQFLPAQLFLRVHRSFIVAIDKITMVEASRLMVGNVYLPVGRNYKQHVHESLRGISA
jgi:DNA-binding LytR/AlgR family response regulator